MNSTQGVLETIADEIRRCLLGVSTTSLDEAVAALDHAPRVFLAGAGRSALAMRACAMRLMHLGTVAYFVGDVTTPSIQEGDVLVIGSGSGSTGSMRLHAETAAARGASIVLLTIVPSSPIGEVANVIVAIPASSPKAHDSARVVQSQQPLASLFEQTLLLVCDAMVMSLLQRRGVSAQEMLARHANLE